MAKTIEQSKVIVTKGNLALPAAGQVLWGCAPGCSDVALTLSGFPGQPVAYTFDEVAGSPTEGEWITVDDTTVATTEGDIYIGQFTNCANKSYADDIRTIAGRYLTKCDLTGVKVVAPSCPQPQILATYLECFECGDNITAHFSYSDNATQSFGSLRADEETITCSHTIKCCGGCNDCDPQASCDEWIGALVDGMNNDKSKDKSKGYPDRPIKKTGSKDYPFRFFKMQSTILSYCIAPIKEECGCDSCSTTDLISGITGGAAAGTEFTNNTTPAGDFTYVDQLENIAKQIECAQNDVLGKHSTTAFVTGGTDDCCPAQLWVITCDAAFALNIEPCDNGINPFEEFVDKGTVSKRDCETGDCVDPEDKISAPCCAIGVIINQDKIECGCDCEVSYPPNTLLRTGKFTFLKDAQDCTPKIKTRELLCPKAPTGSGGYTKWAEFNQSATNECWRDTSSRQGPGNSLFADKAGRHANAAKFSDCKKQYCVYHWENKSDGQGIDKELIRCHYKTEFHIPTCDVATIDSFTLFYEALAAESGAKCVSVKTGRCLGQGEATLEEAVAVDCDGLEITNKNKT